MEFKTDQTDARAQQRKPSNAEACCNLPHSSFNLNVLCHQDVLHLSMGET
jgi:hypothetical protein